MKRPYIPDGCDQQGHIVPTRAASAMLTRARTGTAKLLAAHVIGDDPHDGPPDAATRPAPLGELTAAYGRSTLLCAVIAVLAMVLLALGGCGGGGDDDTMTTQPVNCTATPQVCR